MKNGIIVQPVKLEDPPEVVIAEYVIIVFS